MSKIVSALFAFLLLSITANAKGVGAGTNITNIATLEYQMGGTTHSTNSNSVTDRVDQLIDVNIVWQEATPVLVGSGEISRVLTYKITNTGNGKDKFSLTHSNEPSSNFNIDNPKIFADTNNNGIYDGGDLLVSEITLDSDGSSVLFLVSDIPATPLANGDQSKNTVEAISKTGGSGASGTIHSGAGINGVDGVDGFNGGRSKAVGIYEINNVGVKLIKNASANTSEVFIGSIITYSIVVSLDGVGIVDTLVVRDVIPAGTSYVAGSLRLDGASLSDASDGDIGSFANNEVVVNLGTVEQSASVAYSKTITFEVRID